MIFQQEYKSRLRGFAYVGLALAAYMILMGLGSIGPYFLFGSALFVLWATKRW